MKKLTVRIKSWFMKRQNQNFDFAHQNPPINFFSESVEVTSWASNFDRNIHLLKIMPFIRTLDGKTDIYFVCKTVWRHV